MGSRIESRILDNAIELFADFGYFGVTTRDVAKRADVTEGSIYRIFRSKKKLFEKALKSAHDGALDPAKFLYIVFDNRGKQDFPSLVATAVRSWYRSLSRPSARLLTQAYFVDAKWRQMAYGPIDKIIEILSTLIEREQPNNQKFNASVAARTLIMALLQFKITYASACSEKDEAAAVEAITHQWLQGLALV